jgi:tRNA(Ile)-lysidine synthase
VPVVRRDPRLDAWRDRVVGLDGPGAGPVVVGCSGGADSVALLALALDAGGDAVAVHVDHGLREGSAKEADQVRRSAARLGAACTTTTAIVVLGPNLEARARDARYAALEAVRRRLAAEVVLVGHTADDQAETILLNLMRGSGSAGLAGMAVRRDTIVRPLLGLRRADTVAICAAVGADVFHDPMNDDRSLRRVWVRHEALPFLGAGAGRDLVPVLVRQAEVLRHESDYLDRLARAAWPVAGDGSSAAALARVELPLARRAVRQWLGSPPVSHAEVDRVLAVARGDIRGTELAGGRRVARRAGQLTLGAE